jgi:hypothetical protein
VRNVEAYIRKAYRDWDTPNSKKLFKKWFGEGSYQSNKNVKIRFKRAMDMMYDGNKFWKVLCCAGSRGACTGCRNSRVLAYVTAASWSNRPKVKVSETHIRVCALAFTKKQ